MSRRIEPGASVIVTAGPVAGLRGVVRGRDTMLFGDVPVWIVEFPGALAPRSLREDYLRRAEVAS